MDAYFSIDSIIFMPFTITTGCNRRLQMTTSDRFRFHVALRGQRKSFPIDTERNLGQVRFPLNCQISVERSCYNIDINAKSLPIEIRYATKNRIQN